MKLLGGVAVGPAALVLAGTTFLLSAVGTQGASCGTATAAAVFERTVAGCTGDQLVNATASMNAAAALPLDARAQLFGVMAAMGEPGLRKITYGDYETSSVNTDGSRTAPIGLFQQDSWGSRGNRLNPSTAATLSYQRLVKVNGWESLPGSEAIHRVQINSNPNHYAEWETPAQEVTAELPVARKSGNNAAAQGTNPGAWGGFDNGGIPQGQLAPIPWSDIGPLYPRPDAAAHPGATNEAYKDAHRNPHDQRQRHTVLGRTSTVRINEKEHARRRRQVADSLGKTLRRIRSQRGLTQTDVAQSAGLSAHAYGCLERGRGPAGGDANPTIDTLLRICAALGIEPSDLHG